MARRQRRVWTFLPSELLMHHVLVCLPLPKVFEFRMVCRSWAAHLSSPSFLQAWSTHPVRRHEEPCLVMAPHPLDGCRNGTLVAYFPAVSRYVHLPLHLKSEEFCWDPSILCIPTPSHTNSSHPQCTEIPRFVFTAASVMAMASAGGLICTVVHKSVVVFNPLNGNLKVLPPLPEQRAPGGRLSQVTAATHMLVHPNLLSYKVFVQVNGIQRFSFQVYDSLEQSWSSLDRPSNCLHVPYGIERADLYFWHNTHKTIYGYHAYADTWSSVYFNTEGKGFSRDNFTWSLYDTPCIMAYNGRLIFAFILWKIVGDKQKAHSFGFAVYELQIEKDGNPLHWKRIARTPEHVLEENQIYRESMSFDGDSGVTLVHSEKFIFMTCSYSERGTYDRRYFTRSAKLLQHPIAYDLENDKWSYIPSYRDRADMAGIFCCKLRFDRSP